MQGAGLRTDIALGGSEVKDSEGEGKSMRDGRAGFTIVIPFKVAAGRRQEPARTSCSWRGCRRIGEGQPSRYRAAHALKDDPTPREVRARCSARAQQPRVLKTL